MSEDFSLYKTNEQIIQRARQNLAQGPWDFLVGGSESETTMRRNRLALDQIAFRPRILVDVSDIDLTVQFMGVQISMPLILAPVGTLEVFSPEGAIASSQAADKFGTIQVVSSVSQPSLESVAQSNESTKIYQLYIHGDWEWTKDMIARIKASGYKGICITADTASYSRRERPLISGWRPDSAFDPSQTNWTQRVTWDTLSKIKSECDLPMLLKGVATKEDAKIALEHGVDVLWVSNHGGRQLDHGLGTMDILPEIADQVSGTVQIVLDGGIQRGSDVIKAVAMGADVVAIGKMQAWALAAGGAPALFRTFQIMEEEINVAMSLMGVTSFSKLSKNNICKADSVTSPHEMSSWVNKTIDRIL